MMPQRIQRKRTKGWRMPANAKYVGRPAGWGSPFQAGEPYRFLAVGGELVMGIAPQSRVQLVALFEKYLAARTDLHEQIRAELAGKDLACWCPLVDDDGDPMPCHADVLLRIANEES